MKKIILILAIALFVNYANAQKIDAKDLPVTVSGAFAKLYPAIKDVKWEKENGNFEANFDLNKVETSVLFDPIGTLLETESEIKISDLPKNATDYITKTYPNVKIKEASRIKDAKGVITYEAAWKGTEVTFDAKGTFLKEHKEPASKENH
jgi:hypothetical protein